MSEKYNYLPISYQVCRSNRAKLARIIVSASEVKVVVPLRMAQQSIDNFIFEKRRWIQDAQDKLEERSNKIRKLAPDVYCNAAEIPYHGRFWTLTVNSVAVKKIRIEFTDGFSAAVPQTIQAVDVSKGIREALSCWMRKAALHQAETYVARHAQANSLFPRYVRIKTQKSRWGSCGIHNDINLNWLLLLAPPEIFEYVVVHELCHIRIRNHAPEFWSLVAAHMPNYKLHRTWLKENGASLMIGL